MLLSKLKCVCLKQQAAHYQDEPRPRVLHRSEHRGRVDSIHPRSPEQTSHKATPGSTSVGSSGICIDGDIR